MMALQQLPADIVAANDLMGDMAGSPGFGGTGGAMLPEAVTAWAKDARAGDRIVYARGHLQGWSKAGRRMRELSDAGLVALTQDHKTKEYIATRKTRRWREAPAGACPTRVARAMRCYDPHVGWLLDLIREWAAAGKVCPPNREIATIMGLYGPVVVSNLLGRLKRMGAIEVELVEPKAGAAIRVITDLASGATTARPEMAA